MYPNWEQANCAFINSSGLNWLASTAPFRSAQQMFFHVGVVAFAFSGGSTTGADIGSGIVIRGSATGIGSIAPVRNSHPLYSCSVTFKGNTRGAAIISAATFGR